jgi:hypothetical protein
VRPVTETGRGPCHATGHRGGGIGGRGGSGGGRLRDREAPGSRSRRPALADSSASDVGVGERDPCPREIGRRRACRTRHRDARVSTACTRGRVRDEVKRARPHQRDSGNRGRGELQKPARQLHLIRRGSPPYRGRESGRQAGGAANQPQHDCRRRRHAEAPARSVARALKTSWRAVHSLIPSWRAIWLPVFPCTALPIRAARCGSGSPASAVNVSRSRAAWLASSAVDRPPVSVSASSSDAGRPGWTTT